jgi:hypothetical protein
LNTPVGGNPLTGINDSFLEVGPDMFSTFKDSQGRFRTQSLFWEHRHSDYPAFFTTKKGGREGYINMYEKYMAIGDPTEYQVAIQLLGSWDHWQALQKGKWFQEHLVGWRDELKTKLESKRYFEMEANVSDPKTTVQATKWLATRYGESAEKVKKRGRPTKVEKANHLRRIERQTEDTKEDAERLGLKIK